jgi:peroxiredoxin
MVLTESTMLPLGTQAPEFRLPDPDGREHALADFKSSPVLLVAFICNHCPFVKHVRKAFAALAREYAARGVAVVGINSNDFEAHPDDAPLKMKLEVREVGYGFPYLVDASQSVAKAYKAACTPDFYVFDAKRKLAYRGQMDSSRPGNDKPNDGADLRAALDAVLTGKPAAERQRPSAGCNIKWKPGNAPTWFGG